ncbi:MAG: NAD(+) diphosphatase [Ruminococcus sp.]|nr:NAD(+) diphosphatase [Ruminococcus sp.]
MIQDIYPHRLDNSYKRLAPKPVDKLMVYNDGGFYIKAEIIQIELPVVTDSHLAGSADLHYLFSIDEKAYFLYLGDPELSDKFKKYSITEIRRTIFLPKYEVFALFTAYHLAEWYLSSQFCGRCGAKTAHDTSERAMYCPECKRKTYPRINPAVIIGVRNGDKLLITRYNRGYAHNALVAGFTEIGEIVEETVSREVMEETGLKVKNIRYYKSQPWGVAADILMGFFCDVDGDDKITMDQSELKYAEWVNRKDIVLQPQNYSLTNEMMKLFKDNGYIG